MCFNPEGSKRGTDGTWEGRGKQEAAVTQSMGSPGFGHRKTWATRRSSGARLVQRSFKGPSPRAFGRGGGGRAAGSLCCAGRAGPEEKVLEGPGTRRGSAAVAAVGGEGAVSVPGRAQSCQRFALLVAGTAVGRQPVSGPLLGGSGGQRPKPGPGGRTPVAQPGGHSPPAWSRPGARAGVGAARGRPPSRPRLPVPSLQPLRAALRPALRPPTVPSRRPPTLASPISC